MKERPILFQSAMVRALLAGRKTQTRRAMRIQPSEETTVHVEHFHQTVIDRLGDEQPGPEVFGAWWDDGESGLVCPYGAPGDRLWAREAWRVAKKHDTTPPRDLPPRAMTVMYEAGGSASNDSSGWSTSGPTITPEWRGKYRPPMFMPRWACRLVLEVTSVRVERLQAISEEDARAEGVGPLRADGRMEWGGPATDGYADLWESINGKTGPLSWDANPFCWVIEFRRAP